MGTTPEFLQAVTGASPGPAQGWCPAGEEGRGRAIAVSGQPANLLKAIYRLFVQSNTSLRPQCLGYGLLLQIADRAMMFLLLYRRKNDLS